MRGVILRVGNGSGFCALEVVRAMVNGAERVEVRLASALRVHFAKLTAVVQLTSVNARGLLYGEFAITTNPLTAARVS